MGTIADIKEARGVQRYAILGMAIAFAFLMVPLYFAYKITEKKRR